MVFKTLKKLAFAFFILLPFLNYGQSPTVKVECKTLIKGIIVDSQTHQALPFASVYIEELKRGTISTNEGDYRIESLCPGEYTFMISMVGYKTLTAKISLNKNTNKEFVLDRENIQLQGITIEGKTEKETIQSKNTISERALENMRGKSLAASLQTLPGVNMIQAGPSVSKPVIHGMHSNRVLILNNGVRLEGQQWGSEHAPEIDPFVASELSVIRGASSVRYGSDAIGGVILVQPKKLPFDSTMHGEINLVGISNGQQGIASGILEGGIAKLKGLSYRLQGTYKIAGNLRTPKYYLKNTGAGEVNFSGAIGYKKGDFTSDVFFSRFNTKLGVFTGSHLISIPSAIAAVNSDKPLIESGFTYKIDRPRQEVSHNLLKFNNSYYFHNLGKLSLIYALQYNSRKEFDAHRPRTDSLAALNKPEVNFQLSTQTGELIFEHNAVRSISGSVGLSGMRQVNIFDPLTRRLIPNFRSYNGGVFIIERIVKEKFELEAGFRYDYKWVKTFDRKKSNSVITTNLYTFNNFTGSMGGIYHIDPHWTVRANAGTAWRPPSINEWFFYGRQHGEGRFIKGDSTLKVETAYNLNTTLGYKGHKLSFEISPYLNLIDNYIYQRAETFYNTLTEKEELRYEQTIAGAYPSFKYTQADALFNGLDVTVDFNISKSLTFNSTTSIVRVKNRHTKDYIENIPSDKFQNTLTYNFRDLEWLRSPSISLTNVYVAKQTRIPENKLFLSPPAAYTLFNADVNFSIVLAKQKADIGLSINNIANTRYRDYLNAFRYYADELGRSFIVRIKYPFSIN